MPVFAAAAAAGAAEYGSEHLTRDIDATITRDDFMEEFVDHYEQGQHTVFLGPTGRGKTTVMRDLYEAGIPVPRVGVLVPKGKNKALDGFGREVKVWPGGTRRAWQEWVQERPPYIWKLVGDPRAGFAPLRGQYEPVLRWARGRGDWLWIIPDLQALSDPKFAGVGKEVAWLLLTLREFGGSLWMDAQRPAWIPRESQDQVSDVIVFRNTDEDTQGRLGEIVGVPRFQLEGLLGEMDYHDFLWKDNVGDRLYFVTGDR